MHNESRFWGHSILETLWTHPNRIGKCNPNQALRSRCHAELLDVVQLALVVGNADLLRELPSLLIACPPVDNVTKRNASCAPDQPTTTRRCVCACGRAGACDRPRPLTFCRSASSPCALQTSPSRATDCADPRCFDSPQPARVRACARACACACVCMRAYLVLVAWQLEKHRRRRGKHVVVGRVKPAHTCV